MINRLKISFVGDINFSGIFRENIINDKPIFSDNVVDFLKNSDFVVCNFEGAISDEQESIIKNKVILTNPVKAIDVLIKNNITIFNLANNHIFDISANAFLKSKNFLKTQKIKYFGADINKKKAGEPCYIDKNGIRIALIGAGYNYEPMAKKNKPGVFPGKPLSNIKKIAKEAADKSDYVIINIHAGEEFTRYPSPDKLKFLRKLSSIKQINAIIAHHSHVFQGIEIINDTPIFFSIGNFIFDHFTQTTHDYTEYSAIVQLELGYETLKYKLFPIYINTKNGIIEKANNRLIDEILLLSDFTNYKNKWRKEAYRVVYTPKRIHLQESENEITPSSLLRYSKWYNILLNIRLYKTLIKILRNNDSRPKYIAAFIYKIKKGH